MSYILKSSFKEEILIKEAMNSYKSFPSTCPIKMGKRKLSRVDCPPVEFLSMFEITSGNEVHICYRI